MFRESTGTADWARPPRGAIQAGTALGENSAVAEAERHGTVERIEVTRSTDVLETSLDESLDNVLALSRLGLRGPEPVDTTKYRTQRINDEKIDVSWIGTHDGFHTEHPDNFRAAAGYTAGTDEWMAVPRGESGTRGRMELPDDEDRGSWKTVLSGDWPGWRHEDGTRLYDAQQSGSAPCTAITAEAFTGQAKARKYSFDARGDGYIEGLTRGD